MQVELKVTAGPASGRIFKFEKPDCFLFGRTKDARLSLPDDPYISRQHFLMEISSCSCRITDLGSKNGVFINGIRYGGRKPPEPGVKQAMDGRMGKILNDGDIIIVGNTIMEISIQGKVPCAVCGTEISIPALYEEDKDDVSHRCDPCKERESGEGLESLSESLFDGVNSKPLELLSEILSSAAPFSDSDTPQLSGYHLEKEIGGGNMSRVYVGTCQLSGVTVAVKTMAPQISVDEEAVRLFQREIEITRRLNHKNIVELIEYGRIKDLFFFVVEYVDGMDLDGFIKSRGGKLSMEEAAPIMLGALEGLAYAHRAKIRMKTPDGSVKTCIGVVHRDIKPNNILLAKEQDGWIPKVSDFGISKSFESAGLSDMTQPGMVAGTPVYWPREHITYYRYLNPATDVFSMAAVFYEMLTGRMVREGFDTLYMKSKKQGRPPGMSDFMRVLAENPTIPIRERLADIPGPVANVIDRALKEVDLPPDKHVMRDTLANVRYPNADVFRRELSKAFKKAGIPA